MVKLRPVTIKGEKAWFHTWFGMYSNNIQALVEGKDGRMFYADPKDVMFNTEPNVRERMTE